MKTSQCLSLQPRAQILPFKPDTEKHVKRLKKLAERVNASDTEVEAVIRLLYPHLLPPSTPACSPIPEAVPQNNDGMISIRGIAQPNQVQALLNSITAS